MFIDREDELATLEKLVEINVSAIVYGLRGIGKTTILKELKKHLEQKNIKTLFIDGYAISNPIDLSKLLSIQEINEKHILTELLSMDDIVIIIDEFSTLFKTFSRRKEFNDLESVARYFRVLLQNRMKRGGKSVILCSSAIGIVKKLTMRYFAPLFREFKIIRIERMPIDASIMLAKSSGISDEKYATEIASLAQGNPFYIKKLTEEVRMGLSPEQALEKLLFDDTGDLNIYFMSLYEKLSPTERYIVHLVARDVSKYSQIREKLLQDPYAYLQKLLYEGILKKVKKSPRDTYYYLTDNLFKAWLATRDIPSLGKMSFKAIRVSSLGFEALIREMFREMDKTVSIQDVNNSLVEIGPYKSVFNWQKDNVEADAICLEENALTIIEAHFWGIATKHKINQLLRISEYVKNYFALNIRNLIVISYFGFDNDAKTLAKKYNIKLLTKVQLKEIQRKLRRYYGF